MQQLGDVAGAALGDRPSAPAGSGSPRRSTRPPCWRAPRAESGTPAPRAAPAPARSPTSVSSCTQSALSGDVGQLHDLGLDAFQHEPAAVVERAPTRAACRAASRSSWQHLGLLVVEHAPRHVVVHVAVLEDLDEGGALVGRGPLERLLHVGDVAVHRARHEGGARGRARTRTGSRGRSAEPSGVDLVTLPSSLVGEYWPLVRP